jgi:hypothetical protein
VCDAITIDPLYAESKQLLEVKFREGASNIADYIDKRNTPLLIQTLKTDKKLIE